MLLALPWREGYQSDESGQVEVYVRSFPESREKLRVSTQSRMVCATAMRCLRADVMSEPGINNLIDVALFLPFSCNDRQQLPASRCKAEALEVLRKRRKLDWMDENRPSQGSGPGGRWFESTRPDQPIFSNLHIV